jgi:aspartate carbamoyltransferase catalytic subunit
MQNCLTIDPLSPDLIGKILDRAQIHAAAIADKKGWSSALAHKTVLSLFFEDSTRTRASFEMAVKRLGGTWLNLDLKTSSTNKGETLMDTIGTMVEIAQPAAMIIRHHEYGAPDYIANRVPCPVINAGDSWRSHPTQALLDALTIRQHKKTIKGLTIAICGDVAHSRVAMSNMQLLTKMGAHVRVVAPPVLLPKKFPVENVAVFDNLNEGIKDCDIVMMLRIQKERMQTNVLESDDAYFRDFGLTQERLKHARADALVMHPGPINRGVEIDDDVADDPKRSLILQQVRNGVAARMAVLEWLVSPEIFK